MDEKLRELERAWRAGDDDAGGALLRERLRVGQLHPLPCERCAGTGDEVFSSPEGVEGGPCHLCNGERRESPESALEVAALLGHRAARRALGRAADGGDLWVASRDPCACPRVEGSLLASARAARSDRFVPLPATCRAACLRCCEFDELAHFLPLRRSLLLRCAVEVARRVAPVRYRKVYGRDLTVRGSLCGDARCCPPYANATFQQSPPSERLCPKVQTPLAALRALRGWLVSFDLGEERSVRDGLAEIASRSLPGFRVDAEDERLTLLQRRHGHATAAFRDGMVRGEHWWIQAVLLASSSATLRTALGLVPAASTQATTRLGWALLSSEAAAGSDVVREGLLAVARHVLEGRP